MLHPADHQHPSYRSLQVNKLEITADKQLLAAAGNPAVKIFEVAAAAPQPIHSFDGHTSNVTGRPCSGSILACTCGQAQALALRAAQLKGTVRQPHSLVAAAVGFEKHSKWMWTASEDGTVKVWRLQSPKP